MGTPEGDRSGARGAPRPSQGLSAAGRGAACPACDAPALFRAGAFEVCPVCGWPDDPAARRDPDLARGAAGVSLSEARRHVALFGVAYPPSEAGGS